jgi:hypothetical protein
MHSVVEGQAPPSRHLLKPTELPNSGDHAPGEETDVDEGAPAAMRDWARTSACANR